MHGKTSDITHNGTDVFTGLPSPYCVTRYHSLAVERDTLPDCLDITAQTDDGEIMGLRHKTLPVYGVQFHPRSEEHTSEIQSLMRLSYAVFCLHNKQQVNDEPTTVRPTSAKHAHKPTRIHT